MGGSASCLSFTLGLRASSDVTVSGGAEDESYSCVHSVTCSVSGHHVGRVGCSSFLLEFSTAVVLRLQTATPGSKKIMLQINRLCSQLLQWAPMSSQQTFSPAVTCNLLKLLCSQRVFYLRSSPEEVIQVPPSRVFIEALERWPCPFRALGELG